MWPDAVGNGIAEDWLTRAKADLALAKVGQKPGVLLEDLCYHCQQAAEKALKALLIHKNIQPPRTHNIKILLDLLADNAIDTSSLEEASELTDYAVSARYPTISEPVSEDEYKRAVSLAEKAISFVEPMLSS